MMNCPKCSITLLMTDRQGVEIDYCPQCRGIWLDRGELEKIIERGQQAFNQPYQGYPPPHEAERKHYKYDDDHYKRTPYGHKKKNFLGELFDF